MYHFIWHVITVDVSVYVLSCPFFDEEEEMIWCVFHIVSKELQPSAITGLDSLGNFSGLLPYHDLSHLRKQTTYCHDCINKNFICYMVCE